MDSIHENNDPATIEIEDELNEKHAAYVLGRNIWLIQGWLQSVHAIAQQPERPWEWLPLQHMFGTSYDSAPTDKIAHIDEALVALVNAKAVDAAVLVELHRALDEAAEETHATADYALGDNRNQLCDCYWMAASHLSRAGELAASLLSRNTEPAEMWRQLGDFLGKSLYFLADDFDAADFPELINGVTGLARRLSFSATADEIANLYDPISEGDTRHTSIQIGNKLISLLKRLDAESIDVLQKELVSPGPYIVLDDVRMEIVFLGSVLSFDAFQDENAMGGIKLLRALMESPGEFVPANELVAKSGLAIDVGQLYTYVSRFRRVIGFTKNRWPVDFRRGENSRRAEQAFIERQRKPRKRAERMSDPEGPTYKLDLPSNRFLHIV